jgi:hypothetical protein
VRVLSYTILYGPSGNKGAEIARKARPGAQAPPAPVGRWALAERYRAGRYGLKCNEMADGTPGVCTAQGAKEEGAKIEARAARLSRQ